MPEWLIYLIALYLVLKILLTIGELCDYWEHWRVMYVINKDRKKDQKIKQMPKLHPVEKGGAIK